MYVPTQTPPPQKVGYGVVRCSLSKKKPERTEQTEAVVFSTSFFYFYSPTTTKKNTLFFCVLQKHIIITFYYCCYYTNTLSLLSLCWGKGPSSRTRFSITNHTKRTLLVVGGGGGVESGRSARSTRNANRFDSRFWKHTNHHRKLEIFIRRRHAFTFARRRGGERGRRDRGTRRRRDRRK